MRVIILGEYGCFPGRGGACSGYLVQAGGSNVLVDCGSGVMSRIQNHIRIDELDAVLLTHLHLDHCGEAVLLRYARETLIDQGRVMKPLHLYLPLTPAEIHPLLLEGGMYTPHFTGNGASFVQAGLTFDFTRQPHSVESYAIGITDGEGRKVVFSGDTTGSPALVQAAAGADLFVCEATTSGKDPAKPTGPHLTGRRAAEYARQAGVKRLCLTHFWFEENLQDTLDAAQEVYPGAVLAKSGSIMDIS